MTRINHLARMIAINTGSEQMADALDIQEKSVNYLIRYYGYYLVATLPRKKYDLLKELIEKNRSPLDISLVVGIPLTLVNCALKMKEKNDYPEAKQLGS